MKSTLIALSFIVSCFSDPTIEQVDYTAQNEEITDYLTAKKLTAVKAIQGFIIL
jgi:Asp/Glu/hydantoin racemase